MLSSKYVKIKHAQACFLRNLLVCSIIFGLEQKLARAKRNKRMETPSGILKSSNSPPLASCNGETPHQTDNLNTQNEDAAMRPVVANSMRSDVIARMATHMIRPEPLFTDSEVM